MSGETVGLWQHEKSRFRDAPNDRDLFESQRAGGSYWVAGFGYDRIKVLSDEERLLVTERLRRDFSADPDQKPIVGNDYIDGALTIKPPSVDERYRRGLRVITQAYPQVGSRIRITDATPGGKSFSELMCGATFSRNWTEVASYLEEFEDDGHVRLGRNTTGAFDKTLRTRLSAFRVFERGAPETSTAFVAMWFNAEVAEAYLRGIEPAIRDAGYIPERIDHKEFNDKIDDEIIASIRASSFVVADFTSESEKPRGGVYYEAGFAQGIGLPVIWTCRSDMIEELHFDTRQFNHIVWSDPQELKVKLLNRILATLGEGPHK